MPHVRKLALVILITGCTKEAPKAAAAPDPSWSVSAQPATGDFNWALESNVHPLRSGIMRIGEGGWLEVTLADANVDAPCALASMTSDPHAGPERVQVAVPRGLDEDYPLARKISPDTLWLLPTAKDEGRGSRWVPRFALEIESVEWKPGGRVNGRLAWVSPPREVAGKSTRKSFGEGRFDLPLCASQSEIDALGKLPKARKVAPAGPIKGRTLTSPFVAARAFAELRKWHELAPHVVRIELYADPVVTCATRDAAKGTSIVIDIDSETGLGRHLGSRQPLGHASCMANHITWDCFGGRRELRGFVEVASIELQPGGWLRGTLALEGEKNSAVEGLLDVELCGGS